MLDNTIRSRVPCRNLTTKHEHTYKLPHRLAKTLVHQRSYSPYFHCSHPTAPIVIHTQSSRYNTSHTNFSFCMVYSVYTARLYFYFSRILLQVVNSRRESDAGNYWCEAKNELGVSRSRNATLQVAGELS